VDVVEPDASWLAPIHLGLVVFGWYQLRRRSPDLAWLFAIPVATLLASTWLFYGYVRLVVAYMPVLWVLQALALAALAARGGAGRRLASHGAALAAGVLILGLAAVLISAARPRAVVLDGVRSEDGQVLVDETVRVRATSPAP
jgi:predicted acyltransferase